MKPDLLLKEKLKTVIGQILRATSDVSIYIDSNIQTQIYILIE